MRSDNSDNIDLENLKIKLSNFRRSAWKPIVEEGDGALTASKIGGKPWLSADESWPICPNCHKPMQFFLQLNLNEIQRNLNRNFGKGILQLFYCTNTEPHCEVDCDGWEPFTKTKIVRIVQPNSMPNAVEIPDIEDLFEAKLIIGWEERYEYPHTQEELGNEIILDKQEWKILDEIIDKRAIVDKLAGWPDWLQYPDYPNCPTCNQIMNKFIFQIDSDDNIPYMWGDTGIGYLVQCPRHQQQLAFLWQCC